MISTQTTTTTTNHYFRALVALLAALAMVASLLLTQPQKPAQAAFPGQNGKIAFVSDRDGVDEVYSMNPDGTGQTRLTTNKAFDDFAAFSPDGKKIAFNSYRDRNFEIYAMNPDGTGQANLTNLSTADDFDPDWGASAAVTASTAPTVTNLSPPPNSTTSDRTPTIKATVADKETNLQKSNIKFFLDGQAKTGFAYSASTDRLTFTPNTALTAATHTVNIVATDAQGQSTSKSWSFTVTK